MGHSDVREYDIREADVAVVGAGSAGAALAARVSEDPSRRVLLIEAGRDTAPGEAPADIRNIFPAAYINGETSGPASPPGTAKARRQFLSTAARHGWRLKRDGMIALRGLPRFRRLGTDARAQLGLAGCAADLLGHDRRPRSLERNARGPNVVPGLPRASWPAYTWKTC